MSPIHSLYRLFITACGAVAIFAAFLPTAAQTDLPRAKVATSLPTTATPRRAWSTMLAVALPPADPPRLVEQVGHAANVKALALSPDGRLLLTGGEDRRVMLWEARTGILIRTFLARAAVSDVHFSADGRFVLARGSKMIAPGVGAITTTVQQVWESSSGRLVRPPDDNILGAAVVAGNVCTCVAVERTAGTIGLEVREAATGTRVASLDASWKGSLSSLNQPTEPPPVEFSPDGGMIAVGGDAVRVFDAATGKGLRTLGEKAGTGLTPVFSPDGGLLAAATETAVYVWDGYGTERGRFAAAGVRPGTLVFDATGHSISVALASGTCASWAVADGTRADVDVQEPFRAKPFVLSARAGVVAAIEGGEVLVGGTAKGWAVIRLKSANAAVRVVSVSRDGQTLAHLVGDTHVVVWDVVGGRVKKSVGPFDELDHAALSPDGKTLAVADNDGVRLIDVSTDRATVLLRARALGQLAFRPDGAVLAVGDAGGAALYDVPTGKLLRSFRHRSPLFTPVAFAPDGKTLACGWSRNVVLWEADTGKKLHAVYTGFYMNARAVAFSPDGKSVAAGLTGHAAGVWETDTGRGRIALCPYTNEPWDLTVAFSMDNKTLVTGGPDGVIRMWNAGTGKEVRAVAGHFHDAFIGAALPVVYAPDGHAFYAGRDDGAVDVHDAVTGRPIATLRATDRQWAVTTPDGRFDTDDLDAIRSVRWTTSDDPFRPLSPDIFMRDYYEPKLLARVMAGEKLPPVRSLSELNRVQPVVKVAKVQPQPEHPDEVRVTVEVAGRSRVLQRPGGPALVESGAFDLHLFRDGRLVARHPDADGPVTLDPKTGRATVTFEHIRLPQTGQKEVEFSAYAFNADRVKSDTHRLKHQLPASLLARKGTAYVVCVGVNAFDDPAWDLRFAVPDAKAMSDSVRQALEKTAKYERVVAVSLLSDSSARIATKDNLRTVLAKLASGTSDEQRLREIPGASELRAARPEDLVLISFSTHGHTTADGQFYLLPSDIGTGVTPTPALLSRCISADELAGWLRNVDAGEMAMITDACHSAATVEVEGFKPGPMGSRGLGQLAYDKRMRILAASQAADVAFEDARIGHGLLTYALCRDGLLEGKADFEPRDGNVSLGEWLRFGVKRVPELAADIANGRKKAISWSWSGRTPAAERGMIFRDMPERRSVAQQPALFDFAKGVERAYLINAAKSPETTQGK